jgi:hypothetical protein
MHHVKTQMRYALVVAALAAVLGLEAPAGTFNQNGSVPIAHSA